MSKLIETQECVAEARLEKGLPEDESQILEYDPVKQMAIIGDCRFPIFSIGGSVASFLFLIRPKGGTVVMKDLD